MINIGKNLREYREKSGVTQQQVADEIGVSKGAIGHWENNIRSVNLVIIERLAKLYHTTVSNLIGDENYEIKSLDNVNLLDKIILDLANEGYFKNDESFEDLDKSHRQILVGALDSHIKKILNK
ncbi:helix-turn-helix domain-containing protein [Clostridium akagii]|uniref:helix-turn-helix domain-containing protein n=1 Tax=Clostridium akagii TaxID=91623 RepID=UPI00068EF8D3|nr:helix-turn-helix transcriptional regulator [Clostridium akagii]